LCRMLLAHPIRKKPYNAIRFVRFDGKGIPLYRVGKSTERGAAEALRLAFETHGGHCFHCKKWMPPQKMSHHCTRDHVRPRVLGGGDHLHNLVFACGNCNRRKGGQKLIMFDAALGDEYTAALEAHLIRALNAMRPKSTGSKAT